MTWKKLDPVSDRIADMDEIIAVGLGYASLFCDGKEVVDGEERYSQAESEDDLFRFCQAEEIAKKDPEHDWRVVYHGPLNGSTFQRQGAKLWVLVDTNDGFA